MPRGHFTENYVTVTCSICGKEWNLTQGEYDWRIKRSYSGKLYCSLKCRHKGITTEDIRETRLVCQNCKRDFTDEPNKYFYRNKVKKLKNTGRCFCSVKCLTDMINRDPDHIKKVGESQRGVPMPQRGRMEHDVSEKTKLKQSLARIHAEKLSSHWTRIDEEMKNLGITDYVTLNHIVPDAIWIEDNQLVAFEYEHKARFIDVQKKMKQYMEYDKKYSKVILVWYDRENIFRGTWIYENKEWIPQ